MNKRCIGCGSTLQNNDPSKSGYTPLDKITSSSYCERCYKIIHYNQRYLTKLENINSYILEEVNKKAKYVYYLIDFLNINNETINTYHQIKVPKSLVISKLDIIPKSLNKEKLSNYLKENYQINEPIFYQSTKKNLNTKSLINNLINNKIGEVYLLGYTNSGKSNLINKINQSFNDKDTNLVTTSSIPNTTIDFIKINITPDLRIIDSPGFTLEKTIYQDDEYDLIEKVNPKKFLKPLTYQTKLNTSFIIEDRIKIEANSLNSFTFYMSNDIKINRVFNNDKNLTNYTKIELTIPDNSDLVIKSLGFINIKKSCTITIYSNNNSLFEVRNSCF